MKYNLKSYPYVVERYSPDRVHVYFWIVDKSGWFPVEGRQAVALLMNEAPTDFRPFDVEW